MSISDEMQSIIEDLADLFGSATDMGEMDAADFKDAAGEIWALRQRAVALRASCTS